MADTGTPVGTVPKVKVCGLTRRGDAELAARAGADFLGVVLVPGTPRALTPGEGRRVASGLDLPVVAVLADLDPVRAARAAEELGADVLQLHGTEPPETLERLRSMGSWPLWKAVRIRGPGDLETGVERYLGVADALLLEGWHPRRLGGTGRTFDWDAVEEMRGSVPADLGLVIAGGLNPSNVAEAIRRLRPGIVDVSSGVERSPGIKDPEAVRAFLAAVRGGGAVSG